MQWIETKQQKIIGFVFSSFSIPSHYSEVYSGQFRFYVKYTIAQERIDNKNSRKREENEY
ncbi:hypothetical protein B4119_0472 [Parageobacillus caldoxylosilyticus]|uniref:Uncharacterized protein n=1 Tax=Saccharococcus caldoxylosilyticus TaxID=81408 RepID=A0A150LH96_9BACL|nr:hypothetical protein B4119_0472 [Parageobacillus caldoxylosilyticus]